MSDIIERLLTAVNYCDNVTPVNVLVDAANEIARLQAALDAANKHHLQRTAANEKEVAELNAENTRLRAELEGKQIRWNGCGHVVDFKALPDFCPICISNERDAKEIDNARLRESLNAAQGLEEVTQATHRFEFRRNSFGETWHPILTVIQYRALPIEPPIADVKT